jgi:hypothetical protein
VIQLANAIQGHPSLKTLKLQIHSWCFPLVLPGLINIPLLSKVVFRSPKLADDTVGKVAEVEALAAIFHLPTSPDMELGFLTFVDPKVCQVLLQAIATSHCRSLTLENCTVDSVSLANSLSVSCIEKVRISGWFNWERGDGRLNVYDLLHLSRFLSTLATFMLRLKQLDLLDLFKYPHVTVCDEEDLLSLVQTAAISPRLSILKLPHCRFTSRIDRALAECLRSNAQLEELAIHCPRQPPAEPKVCTPELIQALKSNYAVKRIILHYHGKPDPAMPPDVPAADSSDDESVEVDDGDAPVSDSSDDETVGVDDGVEAPWDPISVRVIDSITRLNAAGRIYRTTDAANQGLGLSVLEKVTTDLDCLFFHVRENPGIVGRLLH